MYTRLYKHTHTHTNTNKHTLCFGTRIYCVYVAYSLGRRLNTPMLKYRTLRTQCSNWKVFSKRPDAWWWDMAHTHVPASILLNWEPRKFFENFSEFPCGCRARGDFFLSDVYEKFLKKFDEHDGSLSFSKMTKSCLAWRVYSCVHICLLRRWLYLSSIRGGCDTCGQRKETISATLT